MRAAVAAIGIVEVGMGIEVEDVDRAVRRRD
jgi:hypothetical protein